MHPICQQTLTANFTNSELQRHGLNVDGLLANPQVRKFVDWVAKKEPDFTASPDEEATLTVSVARSPFARVANMMMPIQDIAPLICVAALYRFARLADCERLRGPLERLCSDQDIKGTLLLAPRRHQWVLSV